MASEPTFGERQKAAFDYLRTRARRAHVEGDGLQVNSLCADALAQIESLAKQGRLQVTLGDVRWCFILPLYWLIDTFMPQAVDRALVSMTEATNPEDPLTKLIRTHCQLVSEPLADVTEELRFLQSVSLDAFGEKSCEHLVLLTHIIELVWYRSPSQEKWRSILDQWLQKCPGWGKLPLQQLKTRLTLQTRLACPGMNCAPADIQSLPDDLRLAELWIHLLCGDASSLDACVQRLNAVTSPDSHVARLLFDFHHFNRFSGTFGEPQEVGLARRRLLTSSSPLLAFNELREIRLSRALASLFRQNESTGADRRFEAFTIAMMCELSALRIWDWAAWRAAIQAQSEATLEACKWGDFSSQASHGIFLAVQSFGYRGEAADALIQIAVSRLEFASEETLVGLTDDLMGLYLRQRRAAYDAFADLGDLVPKRCWFRVVNWTLNYLEEMREKKHFGFPEMPFRFWSQITGFLEESSEIWELITPEALRLARNSLMWRKHEFFDAFLSKAPVELARRIGIEMLAAEVDGEDKILRAAILLGAERDRPPLRGTFLPDLLRLAGNPVEKLRLGGTLSTEEHVAVKSEYLDTIRHFLSRAVWRADQSFDSRSIPTDIIAGIRWSAEDTAIIQEIINVTDSPNVVADRIPDLVVLLKNLVQYGPKEFANIISPRACAWLKTKPSGRSVFNETPSPFSGFTFRNSIDGSIQSSLAGLAFELQRKLGTKMNAHIATWLTRAILTPDQQAVPNMLFVGLCISVSTQKTARTEIFAVCQMLLLHLCSRQKGEPEARKYLAQSLNYLAHLLGEQQDVIRWETAGGKAVLNLVKSKLAPVFLACSHSTHPDIRSSIAALIRNLKNRSDLPHELEQALGRLAIDNRARVRAASVTAG